MTNGIRVAEGHQVLQQLVELQLNEGRREPPPCGEQHLLLGSSSLLRSILLPRAAAYPGVLLEVASLWPVRHQFFSLVLLVIVIGAGVRRTDYEYMLKYREKATGRGGNLHVRVTLPSFSTERAQST